ncbi:MAG: IS110 family transposase [Anaerolineales bacterium]
MSKTKPRSLAVALPLIHPQAAGLDIGAREIWACAPTDPATLSVRSFGTFTPDLHGLADWLQAVGVQTVAMESTGVYWIAVFEILEARGLEVYVVNARHLKNVPGRKSDVQDCQWIQRLHSHGLLSASFRPEAEMRALRAYLRQRAMLLEYRAAHIQHMQKALQQMNVQLTQVLSDISGVTGLEIIRAIVAGERDPVKLARFRNPRCKSSADDIAKALSGNYRLEHVFALQQAWALYDFYSQHLQACDQQIEHQYSAIKPTVDDDLPPRPPDPKVNSHSKNAPTFDVRQQLYRLTGVDLTVVDGLDDSSAQTVLAEIGTDMSKWPTVKHFCSWLGLAPHTDITGGKVIKSRTRTVHNRAAQALRLAAQSLHRSQSALGACYRRMRARLGGEQAIVATAHKLARIIYYLLKHHVPYQPITADVYDQRQRDRELKSLQRKATQLGYSLIQLPAQS